MVTITEIAEKTGLNRKNVKEWLRYKKITPASQKTDGRKLNYYDDSVVSLVKEHCGKNPPLSDEEKKRRRAAMQRRYREKHASVPAAKEADEYYKVSVRNAYHQWEVRACGLLRSEAKMISDELNKVGITARFKPHSYGLRRTA